MVDDLGDAVSAVRAAKRDAKSLTTPGVVWWVYELPATAYDRRATPSLVFESESVIRRVRNYPPDWRRLDEKELARLMEGP